MRGRSCRHDDVSSLETVVERGVGASVVWRGVQIKHEAADWLCMTATPDAC